MAACPTASEHEHGSDSDSQDPCRRLLVIIAAIAASLSHQAWRPHPRRPHQLTDGRSRGAPRCSCQRAGEGRCGRLTAKPRSSEQDSRGPGRPERAPRCNRQRREGDDGLSRAPCPPATARPGRPDDRAHRHGCRRHRPQAPTAGVGRVTCRRRAVDRTAGAAGTVAAVGEQHCRDSGAMEAGWRGQVCCPDEFAARSLGMTHTRYTDASGYDERNRVDCRRPGADCRSSHEPVGVRKRRRHAERDAAGRGRCTTPTHCSGATGLSASRPAWTSTAGGCFAFRAIRWIDGKRTTITGVVLGQPGDNQIAAGLGPPTRWSTASPVSHGAKYQLCRIYGNDPTGNGKRRRSHPFGSSVI